MPLYKIERDFTIRQVLLVVADSEQDAIKRAELGRPDNTSIVHERYDSDVSGKVLTIQKHSEETIDRCPECGRVNGLKVAVKGTP